MCMNVLMCQQELVHAAVYVSVLVFDLSYERMRDLEAWVYGWDCCHFCYNPCMNRYTNGRGCTDIKIECKQEEDDHPSIEGR